MVKRLTQWHPREGLGRDEALRYWTEQHAKLLTDVRDFEDTSKTSAPSLPTGVSRLMRDLARCGSTACRQQKSPEVQSGQR